MNEILQLVPEGLRELAPYRVPSAADARVKLDANEHPFPLPEEVRKELAAELAATELHRYPPADGGELRAALAREAGLAPDEPTLGLSLGNGSDELILLLTIAFSRPRQDGSPAGCAYPVPTFSVFRTAALAASMQPLELPLSPRFELDPEATDAALAAHRPNICFLARPNNPTGTSWPLATVRYLAERHRQVLFVSDEAYGDYGGESATALLAAHPNLVVLRTLSKIGLAGLRIGYLCAEQSLVAQIEKVRPPYNIGALNQRAAVLLLSRHRELIRERCQQVVVERERLRGVLAGTAGIDVFASSANLLLFRVGEPNGPSPGQATAVWKGLAERGVLIRCFDNPGPLAGCLRVTVGTPAENDAFLAALAESLA